MAGEDKAQLNRSKVLRPPADGIYIYSRSSTQVDWRFEGSDAVCSRQGFVGVGWLEAARKIEFEFENWSVPKGKFPVDFQIV